MSNSVDSDQMLHSAASDLDLPCSTLKLLNMIISKSWIDLVDTLQPLYNTVHYNSVLDITQFKDGSQKCIDYIEKMTINGHFSI